MISVPLQKNLLAIKCDGQTGSPVVFSSPLCWQCCLYTFFFLQSEGQSGCLPAGVSALKFYVHVVILCLVTQDSLLLPSLISSKFILFLVVEDSAPKDYFFF